MSGTGPGSKHAKQVRAAVAARAAAVKRLIAEHKEEYRAYLIEESEARGVRVREKTGLEVGTKAQKRDISDLLDEIRRTGMLDGKPMKPYQVPKPKDEVIAAQRRTRAEELEIRGRMRSNIPPLPGSESENV